METVHTRPSVIGLAERVPLVAAIDACQSASDAHTKYFYARMGEIKEPHSDPAEAAAAWNTYRDGVLYAGKDPEYSRLKEEESAAKDSLESVFSAITAKHPWFGESKSSLAWRGDTPEHVDRLIKGAYTHAFNIFFAEKHADEIAALRTEIEKQPLELDPAAFPAGTMVLSDIGGSSGTYRISRQTHNGKRTFGVGSDGGEIRLPAGRCGDGYLTSGCGYRQITREWADRNAALTTLWAAEGKYEPEKADLPLPSLSNSGAEALVQTTIGI